LLLLFYGPVNLAGSVIIGRGEGWCGVMMHNEREKEKKRKKKKSNRDSEG